MGTGSGNREPTLRETAQAGLGTIGGRLSSAIEQRPPRGRQRGVRMFQRDMQFRAAEMADEGRRLPGVTVPSIMSYLNGHTEPSITFLREAAVILGVREAWLVTGTGERTEADGAVSEGAGQAQKEDDWESVIRVIEERAGASGFTTHAPVYMVLLSTVARLAIGELHPVPPANTAETESYMTLAGRLHGQDYDASDPPERRLEFAVARYVGRALRAPFDGLALSLHDLSESELLEFVSAVCLGVRGLVDAHHRLLERAYHDEEDEKTNG